ncbi:DUF1837 domain-containing protein [Pantoea sp.]|uniref:HamA C-terminal domain-containing protein n=1 Tax=Pantoea sp. TaxID=69393 RepID=UPI0031D0A624
MDGVTKLLGVDWGSLIEADHSWIKTCLTIHPENRERKIVARFYSVPFSGLQQEINDLAERIADSIEEYVFDSNQLKEMHDKGVKPFRKAAEFFGDTNPIVDGKYGELMLYALSESVLNTPMITHKITSLTNVNDQVKGGDGIFFGRYNDSLSILIGESKIYQNFSSALESAFDSINRFNSSYSGSALSHEMFIARSNIAKIYNAELLDLMYEAFTPGSEIYKECLKNHPVLIVFEDEYLSEIESLASNKKEAESLYNDWLEGKRNEICSIISDKYNKYPELRGYFLDFFLLPMKSVSNFKKALYKSIHGIDYKEPPKTKEKKTPPKAVKKRAVSKKDSQP